jgi:endonuclease III
VGKAIQKDSRPVTMDVFEKAMVSIAKTFGVQQKLLDSHTKALETIITEMGNLREDNKYIRSTLSSFVRDVSVHDRKLENLLTRVEKLEEQVFA